MSTCCGGNCGCGSNCSCGNGCGGCKMYPDMSYSEIAAPGVATVLGVAVAPKMTYGEGTESENGCKCGDNCTCNPCNCK